MRTRLREKGAGCSFSVELGRSLANAMKLRSSLGTVESDEPAGGGAQSLENGPSVTGLDHKMTPTNESVRGRLSCSAELLCCCNGFGPGHRHMKFHRRPAIFVKQLAACGLDNRLAQLLDSAAGFFTGCKRSQFA